MPKKKISEREAWRECAEWVASGPYEFLCHYLLRSIEGRFSDLESLPAHWPHEKMYNRLTDHIEVGGGSEYSSALGISWTDEEYERDPDACAAMDMLNHPRVMFCLLMEMECAGQAGRGK